MGAGESVAKAEASTQTEPDEGNSGRRKKTSLGVKPKDYPQELLDYTPGKRSRFKFSGSFVLELCYNQRHFF